MIEAFKHILFFKQIEGIEWSIQIATGIGYWLIIILQLLTWLF